MQNSKLSAKFKVMDNQEFKKQLIIKAFNHKFLSMENQTEIKVLRNKRFKSETWTNRELSAKFKVMNNQEFKKLFLALVQVSDLNQRFLSLSINHLLIYALHPSIKEPKQ